MTVGKLLAFIFVLSIGCMCSHKTLRKTTDQSSDASNAITCSGIRCIAVGYYLTSVAGTNIPLIVQSSDGGKTFTNSTSAPLPGNSVFGNLKSITCIGERCIAVGSYQLNTVDPTDFLFPLIVQSTDGGKTFLTASQAPLPVGGFSGELLGITCTNMRCIAVGYYQPSSNPNTTLPFVVQSEDGGNTFPIATQTPLPPQGVLGALLAITCLNSECVAVGFYRANSITAPPIRGLIVQSENGGITFTKAIEAKLPSGGVVGQLVGIACSDQTCNAVGFYQTEFTPPPMTVLPFPLIVQSFDGGKTFTDSITVSLPNGGRLASFGGINSTPDGEFVAVGLYRPTAPVQDYQPMISRSMNRGRKFSDAFGAPLPTGAIRGGLTGIKCAGNECIAVGDYTISLEGKTPSIKNKKLQTNGRLPLIIQSANGGATFPLATQAPLPLGGLLGVLGIAVLL